MTATPRLYKEADQKRARENEAYLCSMDDAEIYGNEFYRLGFGEAVDKNLLSDYKVLILNVEPGDVSTEVQIALSGLDADTQKEVDADDMAKLIGCINALSKRSRYDNKLLREIDPQPTTSSSSCPMAVVYPICGSPWPLSPQSSAALATALRPVTVHSSLTTGFTLLPCLCHLCGVQCLHQCP